MSRSGTRTARIMLRTTVAKTWNEINLRNDAVVGV